jgi:hypothetical protein
MTSSLNLYRISCNKHADTFSDFSGQKLGEIC